MKVRLFERRLFILLICLWIGCNESEQNREELNDHNLLEKIKYADIESQLGPDERQLFSILKSQNLTESKVVSFIEALHKILESVNEESLEAFTRAHKLTNEIKKDIEATEWDTEEFYWVGRKVGIMWGLLKSIQTLNPDYFKEEYETTMKGILQGHEKMLANPDLPESTKVEIRKSMQKIKESSRQFDVFKSENMKKKSSNLQNKLTYILEKFASSKEIEVIEKHLDEIEPIIGFLDGSFILQGIGNDPNFSE